MMATAIDLPHGARTTRDGSGACQCAGRHSHPGRCERSPLPLHRGVGTPLVGERMAGAP